MIISSVQDFNEWSFLFCLNFAKDLGIMLGVYELYAALLNFVRSRNYFCKISSKTPPHFLTKKAFDVMIMYVAEKLK